MQHLQEDGGDSAHHHAGEVAVHFPTGAVGAEQADVLPISLQGVVARAADELANLQDKSPTDRC
jgi:hypothetical protein